MFFSLCRLQTVLSIFLLFTFCGFHRQISRAVAALSNAQAKKIKRFLPNPERHWGPKVRAGRKITSKHVSLLGPEAINGAVNGGGDCHKEGNGDAPDNTVPEPEGIKDVVENEPSNKRQKSSDGQKTSDGEAANIVESSPCRRRKIERTSNTMIKQKKIDHRLYGVSTINIVCIQNLDSSYNSTILLQEPTTCEVNVLEKPARAGKNLPAAGITDSRISGIKKKARQSLDTSKAGSKNAAA
jgi:tRNA (guanine26-N2/guanine27-N2)-dimethyltransferase